MPCEVSWVGNDGCGNPEWVPQDIDDLCVTPEGDVFTNVGWEEGGGNVARFAADGSWCGAARHTHGWGYGGGEAVAANAVYVFVAQRVENERGGLRDEASWPPKGVQWWGVSRRLRADAAKGAPFAGGKGGKGDTLKGCFKVLAERHDGESESIRGLCATARELFASVKREGVIRVLDAGTMDELRAWPAPRPDRLVMAPTGVLWVLLDPEDERVGAWSLAGFDATSGVERARVVLDAAVRPGDVAIDAQGRLLVSDVGAAQQILLFDGLERLRPRACGAFGEPHGIFGGPVPGRMGGRRLNRPRGVGADAAGNLYVANDGCTGGGGSALESYASDGSLRWCRRGLFFVDLPDLDTDGESAVYSKEERFILDLAKPSGGQTTYAAYTVNPWKYPDDPRIHVWSANAWFLRLGGSPFLFVSNMGQDALQAYRFSSVTDGETAVPAALFAKHKLRTQTPGDDWPRGAPADGAWRWTDRNGDGAMQADEYDAVARAGGGCVFVDEQGTVWRVFKDAACGAAFRGANAVGAPEWAWDDVRAAARPSELDELRRFKIDAARDLAAFGGDAGADRHQHWKPMGPVVAVYRGVLAGRPEKLWSSVLPYAKGSKGHESAEPMSFEIAGDYLFVCYTRGLKEEGVKWAFVKVFGLTDGRFIGNLIPEIVTGELGLLDLEDSLRVRRLRDGSYLLFLEDDFKAKSVMMRWRPN